jgi:hypothetical protein
LMLICHPVNGRACARSAYAVTSPCDFDTRHNRRLQGARQPRQVLSPAGVCFYAASH